MTGSLRNRHGRVPAGTALAGRIRLCASAVIALLILGGGVRTDAADGSADSLFQAAMAQVDRTPVDESLKALRRVLKADRSYAPAYHQIARLYISKNTPMDRQRASEALNRAIRLDPQNVTYRLTRGDLLWSQGFWSRAKKQYEKVLQDHPGSAEAACRIGYYYLKQMMKYQDMIDVEGDDDTIVLEWAHFADGFRRDAIRYLVQSIESAPDLRKAYYHLGLVYLENTHPLPPDEAQVLLNVSKRLLSRDPEDKDALLFCGLTHQTAGEFQKAHWLYTEAFRKMEPGERAILESLDLIATEEEREEVGRVDVRTADSADWVDTPGRERFWQQKDPLLLTDFNEQRMEHYRRVAYANLRFGRPDKGIPGWQTDMGRAYIKFGHYLDRSAWRPEVDARGVLVQPHVETWFFEGFQIAFRNWDGLDGWRFDTTYRPDSDQPSGEHVFNHTPPRYADPYRDVKYRMPHQVAAFREGDSIRVELSYAVPRDRLEVYEPEDAVVLDYGIFLSDEDWQEVFRERDRTVKPKDAALDMTGPLKADGLKWDHLIYDRTLYVAPGSYRVAAEAKDRGSKSIGTFRMQRTFSLEDTALAMSDLLLASGIEPLVPLPGGRNDLKIQAFPLRTYGRLRPVSIYLELYNLMRDTFGRTEYEISYRIGRPDKEDIDPALFAAQDLPDPRTQVRIEPVIRTSEAGRTEGQAPAGEYRVTYVLPERNRVWEKLSEAGGETETAVTARYEGERKDDFTFLQIDVGQMPAGIYKLVVTAVDIGTGQKAERDVLFRVIE